MLEAEKKKLKEAFDEVIASDLTYNKPISDIDYTVLTKAMGVDKVQKVLGCNVCLFNYSFENCPSVLIVFCYYPKEDSGSKHISEKTIDIISLLQDTFITLDYVDIITVKSEPFVYITAVKKNLKKN